MSDSCSSCESAAEGFPLCLFSAGDPGSVFWTVRPDRRVQPADPRSRQQGAGAAAEEADQPEGLDDGRAGLPRRRGEHTDLPTHKADHFVGLTSKSLSVSYSGSDAFHKHLNLEVLG